LVFNPSSVSGFWAIVGLEAAKVVVRRPVGVRRVLFLRIGAVQILVDSVHLGLRRPNLLQSLLGCALPITVLLIAI